MTVFDGIRLDQLTLRQMHFHIVKPPRGRGQDPVFQELGAVDPSGFEGFFLSRVRDSARGNLHVFNDESETLARLRRLLRKEDTIGGTAAGLGREFARHHTQQMSPGVFMLLDVAFGQHILYAMLKFDDREVLRYAQQNAQTVLKRLAHTFVEDTKAMQKVAIARMSRKGEVPVLLLERSDRRDGTDYFRRFLNVRRVWDESDLTKRLDKAIDQTKSELQGLVDGDQIRGALSRGRQFIREEKGFDEEAAERLRSFVFGPDPNGVIARAFSQQLAHQKLDGEAFKFDADAVPPPRKKYLRTFEGIVVTYPPDHEDLISEERGRIIIRTKGVADRDVEPN